MLILGPSVFHSLPYICLYGFCSLRVQFLSLHDRRHSCHRKARGFSTLTLLCAPSEQARGVITVQGCIPDRQRHLGMWRWGNEGCGPGRVPRTRKKSLTGRIWPLGLRCPTPHVVVNVPVAQDHKPTPAPTSSQLHKQENVPSPSLPASQLANRGCSPAGVEEKFFPHPRHFDCLSCFNGEQEPIRRIFVKGG